MFVLLFTLSCKQQSTDKEPDSSAIENKNIIFLKKIYEEYISACCKLSEDYSVLENVKRKYLSEDLYNKLDTTGLDYDPFLDAQDCDENWIKTLEINTVQNKTGIYQIFLTMEITKRILLYR